MTTIIAYVLILLVSGYVVGVVVSLIWILPSSYAIGVVSATASEYFFRHHTDTPRFLRVCTLLLQFNISGLIEGFLSGWAAQLIFGWLEVPLTAWGFGALIAAKVISGYLFFRSPANQLPFYVLPATLLGFMAGLAYSAQ